MDKARLSMGLLLSCTVAWALVNAYHIEPQTAAMSGWTRTPPSPNYFVAQQVTCNWDELDSASGAYVELFVGDLGASQANPFLLDVYEYPGGVLPVATHSGKTAARGHTWLKFPLTVESGYKFTKGKTYSFKFTRGGSDSLQYYYQDNNPYEYGDIVIPGEGNHPMLDLCMRVYGVVDPVDSLDWGFNVGYVADSGYWEDVTGKAQAAGVRADRLAMSWNWVEQAGPGAFYFGFQDTTFSFSHDTLGCEPLGLLFCGPAWASTHITDIQVYEDRAETTWSISCPPVNLWAEGESINYWARSVDSFVNHFAGRCSVWQVWNEPNHVNRFWMRPNCRQYLGDTTDYAMCRLYVRLCRVADSVIKKPGGGHEHDRVLVGSMSKVEDGNADIGLVRGKDWLRWMYEIADTMCGGAFWDGVAIQPYPFGDRYGWKVLDPDRLLANAETLREIMRHENDDFGELWITELGWNTAPYPGQGGSVTEEQQADNFCKSMSASIASRANPAGGYDRLYWFSFNDYSDHHGLLDVGYGSEPYRQKMSCFASAHANDILVGKRFNGRVLSGGAGLDTQAYAYEFEDPADGRRTWVAWQSDGREAEVALPCRVDSLATTELAYGPSTDVRAAAAGADGWFKTRVGARPVFAREPATARISRPDLVVDSIRVTTAAPRAGERLDAVAFLRNVGTRSTPAGLPVVVTLSLDGTEVGRAAVRSRITAAASVTVSVRLPASAAGSRLLSAIANPDARFVELDADNNAAHAPVTILPRTR